jgi:hypothetical protein
MPAVAHRTLLTELQMTIANTLTEIPMLDNIELDPGENKMHNLMGVNRNYEKPIATGVRGVGSISADIIAYDPTDAVHMALGAAFDAVPPTEIVGAYKLGNTGETISVKYIVTKFPVSTKGGAVIEGKFEAVITEKIAMPS